MAEVPVTEAGVRRRRVENEWSLLQALQRRNPSLLAELRHHKLDVADAFELALGESGGILEFPHLRIVRVHHVELRFPRFFPGVPIEARLHEPCFHPNVDAHDGFVCLWSRFSATETVLDALRKLQQVLAWSLVNTSSIHVMQPAALAWFRAGCPGFDVPLSFTPFEEPEGWSLLRSMGRRPNGARTRLS